MTKAIALLSGGLDSTLAVKLVLEQGIEVEAVNFLTVFCTCTSHSSCRLEARKVADNLNIPLEVFNVSHEYIEVVKHPLHGYGKNMNPCIDCRVFMFKKAGEYMREIDASFLVTGEVLGERPMSQRREAMKLIEREAGLEGLILRPLSAKLLQPTIPEKEGLVDREKFLNIEGRSRKPQIQLAAKFQLKDYPCPAGGCLLTDPEFASRIKDLFKYSDATLNDVHLLKRGRHFRLSPQAKLVVGRNEEENKKILTLAQTGDLCFQVADFPGPVTLARGELTDEEIVITSSLTASYSKGREEKKIKVDHWKVPVKEIQPLIVPPMPREQLEGLRIQPAAA